MPGSENQEGEQRGGRVLTVVFWAGVGLAPLAALVLMLGRGEGPLKIAAVLAVLAVVLIGLSITLRRDADTVRLELEDTILDEVDALREDLRQDIATATRATHRQFSEKLQHMHESVEAMRAQLEAMRLGYDRPEARPAGVPGPPAGTPHVGAHHVGPAGGVVRQTETVHVTTRHTIVDPHAEGQGARGTVYGRTAEAPPRRPEAWHDPREADHRDDRRHEGGRHDSGRHDSGRHDSGRHDSGRHDSGRHDGGRHDGGRLEGGEPSVSWTEERLRERFAAARAEDARGDPPGRRSDPPRGAEVRGGRGYEQDDAFPPNDLADDERWSGMRAGDRWASVRTDDRGRELRMGERRAAMHTDETGTELRFEDRWTSVRRDEPRSRYDEPTARWSDDHREDDDREGRTERRGGRRALPAASSEPSWSDDRGWHDAEGGRGDRRRYEWEAEPEEAPVPRARARSLDYEHSDERWR